MPSDTDSPSAVGVDPVASPSLEGGPAPGSMRPRRRRLLAGACAAAIIVAIVAAEANTPRTASNTQVQVSGGSPADTEPPSETVVVEATTTIATSVSTTTSPTTTEAPPPPPPSMTTTTTVGHSPWFGLRRASALDEPGIYVVQPNGDRLSKVAVEAELVANTAFSPSGLQIAFGVADRLEMINLDGTGRRALVTGGVAPTPPVWSPDGRTIAFLSRDEDGYRLKLVDVADGSSRVVAPTLVSVRTFDWHPDGGSLLLGTLDPGIHIVNADGTDLRLHHPTARQVSQVFWAPTGDRVLYRSNGRLFTYVPSSDGERELGFDSGGSINNPWSPDGKRVAIGRGYRYSIYAADGGEQSIDSGAIVIDWAPGGEWLLTRREQPGAPHPSAGGRSLMDLVVMRPDGSEVRTLLADRVTDRPWGHDFEWRPQGDLIVFSVSDYRPDYPRYDRN